MECIKILPRNQFFVNSVKVINDAAERGVKLNSDYTTLLTDNLVQRASLLQAVEVHHHHHHHTFISPDTSKEIKINALSKENIKTSRRQVIARPKKKKKKKQT